MPAALAGSLYLECHLDGAGRVDLIFAVEREDADILAGDNPVIRLPERLAEAPGWRRLPAFSRRWTGDAPWGDAVRRIWIEIDVPPPDVEGGPKPPGAGVFLEYDADRLGPDDPYPMASTVRTTLQELYGAGLPPGREEAVGLCVGALPGPASLPYAGVLFSRGGRDLRLCLDRMTREELFRYLDRVGWPGDRERLSSTTSVLRRRKGSREVVGFGLVHMDVGRRPRGSIGLEYVLDRKPQVRGRIRETRFLRHLEERGWCTEDERRALRAWPGCRRRRLPHRLEPLLESRRVNNVKVVLGPEGSITAKAYLFARHEFRNL